ncbi:MAG: DUF309 domain-containing protein [Anaerolineae bacterium]|nr:DUF309 domain-containing protein [Anaerolineae bacterium]
MAEMRPVAVIAGAPAWADAARSILARAGFAPVCYADPAGYVARLVDDAAAMVLVDGGGADWRFWVTTPKVSPATRRIPVVLVAADAQTQRAALGVGADAVLAPDELEAALPGLLADRARVPEPARLEALARACAEPLPPQARAAIAQFNAGAFYAQHDLLEALWVAERGPVRDLYRGILQVGVAYYQITRGNRDGALKMLLRSVQWLAHLPDVCQGVDVAQLRADSRRVRAALETTDPADMARFDLRLLKPVLLVTAD